MNKFFTSLGHTYLTKLKSKSFIITTAIFILAIIVLSNLSTIIDVFDREEDQEVVHMISADAEIASVVAAQLKAIDNELKIELVDESQEKQEKLVRDGTIDGLLVVNNDVTPFQATFFVESFTNEGLYNKLQAGLQQVYTMEMAGELNLSAEQVAQLNTPVSIEREALNEAAKSEEELSEARGLVYILLFIIYFSVIIYASMVATEVANEKSSRVMEILVSSISPVQQMFAKVFGIALLGMTQLAIILAVGYASLQMSLDDMTGGFYEFFGFGNTSVSTILYGFIFFVLGYLLYATLAAFLGSIVSRIEEVQQLIAPMTILIVIAFMLAINGLSNPEAGFVTVTSFIPFFTPMLMFLRVGMIEVPVYEVWLGIGILVATIVLLGWFGAKVYRGGVLMYGKSASFKDIKKALQLK
ncbi:ABC transporter permease [Mangrovibacillus cuniculi]|uniref:ABC transporter permease n=1 Tax=Mangrovibacillus cuniculi TaxID=2593652 RepID=A0A7S8HF26_9BACI|nr:ABC transporter permease [Mangrovibacillus cuniculi]QPC45980.1 ABC transporter permease [Mangrovibacillus cuniculi]